MIIKGVLLSEKTELFEAVKQLIIKAFPWDEPLEPEFVADNLFFIIELSDIKAVGRLKPDKVLFMNEEYSVMGVADIVSIEKGYGRKLMSAIKKYLEESKLMGLGLCASNNSGFYNKCGFKTVNGSANRIIFKGPQSNDDDLLYFNDIKGLIKKLIANPEEKIVSNCRYW
jgi:hypothetical protein